MSKQAWDVVVQTKDEVFIPEMYYRRTAEKFAAMMSRHPEVIGVGIYKGMAATKPSKVWGMFDEKRL